MEYYLKIYFGDWLLRVCNPFTSAFEFTQEIGDKPYEFVETRFWFLYIIYFGGENGN